MSSSNTSSLQLEANNLNYIAMMFIRCYAFVVMPLGIVGHSMSIYVFTRAELCTNPCSVYFLAATIVGLLNTIYTVPIRMIQSGFVDTDPGTHSIIFCKIIWLCQYSLRGLSPWLIVLACADRYLCSCTSMTKRAWSSIRVANRLIPLTTLLGFIAYVHVPIFFRTDFIPATRKPVCHPPGPPGIYRIVLSFFNLIYFGLSPSVYMLLFGILTFRNITQSKGAAAKSSTNSKTVRIQNSQKTNRQILRMLFIQVLIYCVTSLAFCIAFIATSINASGPKNIFQVAQENMITAVVGMMSNTGPCLSFYLFTLSSSPFRKALKRLFCGLNQLANNQSEQIYIQLSNTDRFRATTNCQQSSNINT